MSSFLAVTTLPKADNQWFIPYGCLWLAINAGIGGEWGE